jgi:hypothetical protein
MASLVAQDWRDERIAELEAELRARDERLAEQAKRIAELEQQVADLLEKLGRSSQNSHLPPSTDPPGTRKWRRTSKKDKPQSKRKRGAQPGHRGAKRDLLPPDKVNKFVDLYSSHCEKVLAAAARAPGFRGEALPADRDPADSAVNPRVPGARGRVPMLQAQDPRRLRRSEDTSVAVRSASDGHHGVGHRHLRLGPAQGGDPTVRPARGPGLAGRSDRCRGPRQRCGPTSARRGVGRRRPRQG